MSTLLKTPPQAAARGCWHDGGMDDVEHLLHELATGSRFERLGVIAREHLTTGGKRLRARLALATMEALGGDRQAAVPWAAATEMLHNATLVHDDLQDGDAVRRGQPAVWARHGVNQAINVGDLMLILPWRALEHLDCDPGRQWLLARQLARCAEEVVRGQSAELDLLPRRRLDWEAYREAAEGKTAALFALPIYGSCVLAGCDPAEASVYARELRSVGTLFQIADDVLDLYGDKGRGEPGADLREGKVSALVVEYLRLHPDARDALIGLLELDRDDTPTDRVAAMIATFREGGALDAVWERLRAIETGVRQSSLAQVPTLHRVALDLVDRALAPIRHTAP